MDEIEDIQSDPDAYFLATFNDGSTFRNLIDYLKGTNDEAYFIFTEKTITCKQSNQAQFVLNDVTINVSDLPEYEFRSNSGKIVVGIVLERLKERMKIGKKDGIRIYKKARNDFIFVQDLTTSTTDNCGVDYFLPINTNEMQRYEVPTYLRDENMPNCVVVATDLTRDFSQMTAFKNENVIFRGYRGGMTLSLDGQGNGGKFKNYGQVSEMLIPTLNLPTVSTTDLKNSTSTSSVSNSSVPKINIKNPDEISSIVVPMKLVKLFIKLRNLSDTSTIRFIFEEGKPMEMICKIGFFGVMRVYVKTIAGNN